MERFIVALAITGIIFVIFMLIKNEITCKNHLIIVDAAFDYAQDIKNFGEFLRITSNLESYEATLHRLWDFGCENILPKADYELIKPYIKEKHK